MNLLISSRYMLKTAVIVIVFLSAFQVYAQQDLHLTLEETEIGMRLNWSAPEEQNRWIVLRSSDPYMLVADTLAITSDTTFMDQTVFSIRTEQFFYQVVPWVPVPNSNEPGYIENFELVAPEFESFPNEDSDPDAFGIIPGGPEGSQSYLQLYGNTWKIQYIDPVQLDISTLWSIDMCRFNQGRMQMIGLGNGEDYMWYVIWGDDAPNSDIWITTYEGWFPGNEWETIYLPVGEDWHGRFGEHPVIDRVVYVNDNDGNNDGVVGFDNLHDVTESFLLSPDAAFTWMIMEETGDSLTVQFNSIASDPDSDVLQHLWSFGDGGVSTMEQVTHTYPRGGNWPVSLRVTDPEMNWDIFHTAVVDSPLTLNSDFTISCGGDVILARGIQDVINNTSPEYVFSYVRPYIEPADLALCNLECPLTFAETRHPTKTIWFKGSPDDARGLNFAGYDWVSLANNHIIDLYG